MKKIVMIICFASSLLSCSKEDIQYRELDVSEYISLIGMSTEEARKTINAELLYSDNYTLNTSSAKYSITLKSSDNRVTEINIYSTLDCSKEDGLLLYKEEMNKINNLRSYCTYVAKYESSSAGSIDFSDRSEFWNYVKEKGVDSFLTEIWWIDNSATRKFYIKGGYYIKNNSISIDILTW